MIHVQHRCEDLTMAIIDLALPRVPMNEKAEEPVTTPRATWISILGLGQGLQLNMNVTVVVFGTAMRQCCRLIMCANIPIVALLVHAGVHLGLHRRSVKTKSRLLQERQTSRSY